MANDDGWYNSNKVSNSCDFRWHGWLVVAANPWDLMGLCTNSCDNALHYVNILLIMVNDDGYHMVNDG